MAYASNAVSVPTPEHNPPSILSEIVIERGPIDVLGHFFMHVDLEARRRGVALEFCTPDDVVAANEANPKSWRTLAPMFNPRYGLINGDNSFSIVGRDRRGEVVTANSIIKFDWPSTDFVEEATSLRLFYADPERMKQDGEQCVVTCERARCITGLAAFSGAAWVRPDYRRLGLSEYLPRFVKAYAAARWDLDCIFGMMAEDVEKCGHAPRFGYDNVDWEARWLNSVLGTHRFAILWTDVDYLAADLRATLARAPAQVDGEVLKRNA
jgi:GNAT superfamily N-acetyltransferase